jgi:hypothetical protein
VIKQISEVSGVSISTIAQVVSEEENKSGKKSLSKGLFKLFN